MLYHYDMTRHYIRYIMQLLAWPTLLIAASLTSIIWLTRALRYIDFIVNRGLSIGDFIYITALLVPSLLMVLLPVSLFIAVLFAYNKLSTDSELLVLKAAGISRIQLALPAAYFSAFIMMICFLISLVVLPAANRNFNDMRNFIRDNYASVLLQEEVFNNPTDKLTVFIRERDDEGNLRGIMVHDARTGSDITMMAEAGQFVNTPEGPRFFLKGGLRQEMRNGKISWLKFDEYTLDISFYTGAKHTRQLDTDEMSVAQLLERAKDADVKESWRHEMIAEVHKRFSFPLYCVSVTLLALAILLYGDHQRRGYWKRLTVAAGAVGGCLVISVLVNNAVLKDSALFPFMYAAPIGIAMAATMLLLTNRIRLPLTQMPLRS